MLKFVWVIYMSKNEKPHNRIAELRKEKGLTLQQVAHAIGVGNNTISRYETGKREPKLETWVKLAMFFGVSVSYLQGLDESEERDSIKIQELKTDLKIGNKYQENNVKNFLRYSADTPIDKLSEHDIKLISDMEYSCRSLIGSLVDFNSFKTIKALKNVAKTLTVITSQYRLFSDNPESFEKRVIPVVNEFLFELKKLE